MAEKRHHIQHHRSSFWIQLVETIEMENLQIVVLPRKFNWTRDFVIAIYCSMKLTNFMDVLIPDVWIKSLTQFRISAWRALIALNKFSFVFYHMWPSFWKRHVP